jgi:putative oxidoreductase
MNSKFTKMARIALGLALLIFGANMIKSFLPFPPPKGLPGYIFSVVGVLEIGIGIMLLLKKWVAFALLLLAPISINIFLFHMFLDLPGMGTAIAIVVVNTSLIYKHWQQYKPLFY